MTGVYASVHIQLTQADNYDSTGLLVFANTCLSINHVHTTHPFDLKPTLMVMQIGLLIHALIARFGMSKYGTTANATCTQRLQSCLSPARIAGDTKCLSNFVSKALHYVIAPSSVCAYVSRLLLLTRSNYALGSTSWQACRSPPYPTILACKAVFSSETYRCYPGAVGMSVDDVEHTLFVCRQVNLYRVPPKATAGGHKSGEWKVADKIFTGRLKLTAKGEAAEVRLEDSDTYVTCCAACTLY